MRSSETLRVLATRSSIISRAPLPLLLLLLLLLLQTVQSGYTYDPPQTPALIYLPLPGPRPDNRTTYSQPGPRPDNRATYSPPGPRPDNRAIYSPPGISRNEHGRLAQPTAGFGTGIGTDLGSGFARFQISMKRTDCPVFVDEQDNFLLRLLPYTIPVPGVDAPDTGCPRDQVRVGSPTAPCEEALTQGSCGPGQWILFNNVTNLGECRERLCPIGFALAEADGFCHDLLEPSICPGGRWIFATASGESVCACKDGWFPDRCGVCQLLFSHEGCPAGLAHMFDSAFQLRCLQPVCPANRPVPFQELGSCSRFGAPCSGGLLGLLTDPLELACLPVGASTASDRSVSGLPGRRLLGRGGRRSRRRRSVFGSLPPLNSCLPGARTDFNTVCRSAVPPPPRRRRDVSRACPTNTSLGRDGRCSQTTADFGK